MGEALEKLWVVVGPTASGKTALAIELAERCNGEVVSADSVQIYRYFDIGSGKPSAEELTRVPHHLIGEIEPTQDIDASTFAALADARINDILARGKRPIVCGGTFLWVRALLFGLAEAPPADAALRAQHAAFVAQFGRAALHSKLQNTDPESFRRLNPNDFVRVSRALEVLELSGRTLSEFHAVHGFRTPRYASQLVGLRLSPDELTTRIYARVRLMLEAGWESEVLELLARGYESTRPMSSVGYRQVAESLKAPSPMSRQELLDAVVRVTRIFARRQRTWLRDQPVHWLTPGAGTSELNVEG
jgi:tRNA dimethylallyltransferase